MNEGQATPALVIRDARKRYGGTLALDGVTCELLPASVHAIVGENGAGKSTLMKILAGAERRDSGTVLLHGTPIEPRSVSEANKLGISIVFQELAQYPHLDVLSNLFAPRLPTRGGIVDRRSMARLARPILEHLGLGVDLDRPLQGLRLSERQLVEIARALLVDAKVVILDEPNSALNAADTERLFAVVEDLRQRGLTILYVSHRLSEVFQISDHVTVLRNGQVVRTGPTSETSIPEVVRDMIGHAVPAMSDRTVPRGAALREEAVRLDSVRSGEALRDVSLVARSGEVLGLAGLEGSGHDGVLELLFGLRRCDGGSVVVGGSHHRPSSAAAAVKKRIAFVPADRRRHGLMMDQSIETNMALVRSAVLGRDGFLMRPASVQSYVSDRARRLRVVMSSLQTPVSSLSGGNQQKVVLGKWFEADPSLVLLNDPTRGVDVGSKREIYELIRSWASEGRSVLFTSTELSEYPLVCDRVLVFYQGRIRGELSGTSLTEPSLLHAINTDRLDPSFDDPAASSTSRGGLAVEAQP